MSLNKYNKGFDRILDKFIDYYSDVDLLQDSLGTPVSAKEALTMPKMDVRVNEKETVIHADIPGMSKDQIELKVDGKNLLSISGESKKSSEYEKADTLISERYYGKFCRTVSLPDGSDVANIQAVHKDGVLEVRVPRKEDRKVKIAIQ